MKTFPEGKKDIPSNGFSFPMFLMYMTKPYMKAIPRGKKRYTELWVFLSLYSSCAHSVQKQKLIHF